MPTEDTLSSCRCSAPVSRKSSSAWRTLSRSNACTPSTRPWQKRVRPRPRPPRAAAAVDVGAAEHVLRGALGTVERLDDGLQRHLHHLRVAVPLAARALRLLMLRATAAALRMPMRSRR